MEKKQKLCYMDTDSFIIYIKIEDIYVDITKNAKISFDNLNYILEKPLPIVGLMKNE